MSLLQARTPATNATASEIFTALRRLICRSSLEILHQATHSNVSGQYFETTMTSILARNPSSVSVVPSNRAIPVKESPFYSQLRSEHPLFSDGPSPMRSPEPP